MKNAKYLLIVPVLIMIYFLFLRSPAEKSGKQAPNFKNELIDGSTFELSQLKGNYVLLDFWGSWCGPCRQENPKLVKLYNEFNGAAFEDAENFEIVTVALEKDERRWEQVSRQDGFNWPFQIVTIARVVLLSPIAQKYNVSGVPSKFLIDPDGHIIGVNQNYQEIRAFLDTKRKG
jgi:thiol-disulfide isomerase/thioredoxin